jgi:hypothetical protein
VIHTVGQVKLNAVGCWLKHRIILLKCQYNTCYFRIVTDVSHSIHHAGSWGAILHHDYDRCNASGQVLFNNLDEFNQDWFMGEGYTLTLSI